MHKFCVVLSLMAVACTVGEDFRRPSVYNDTVIKQELSLKDGNNPSKNWYSLFGDKQLDMLIEKGLKNSTDIERADVAEEVAVAEERALQRLHVAERVIGGHVVIVAVRSQFKHNEYLRKFEIWKASGACLPLLFLTQSLPRNCVQRYAFV